MMSAIKQKIRQNIQHTTIVKITVFCHYRRHGILDVNKALLAQANYSKRNECCKKRDSRPLVICKSFCCSHAGSVKMGENSFWSL